MGVYTGSPALPLLLAGDIPASATDWAAILAELNALSTAWSSWTPTLTNLTLGDGTVSARYRQVGKTADWRFKFTVGSTSSVGTNPTFTLPAAPHSSYASDDTIGAAFFLDAGILSYPGTAIYRGSSTVGFSAIDASGTYCKHATVTATIPFTYGPGDILIAYGSALELA